MCGIGLGGGSAVGFRLTATLAAGDRRAKRGGLKSVAFLLIEKSTFSLAVGDRGRDFVIIIL